MVMVEQGSTEHTSTCGADIQICVLLIKQNSVIEADFSTLTGQFTIMCSRDCSGQNVVCTVTVKIDHTDLK